MRVNRHCTYRSNFVNLSQIPVLVAVQALFTTAHVDLPGVLYVSHPAQHGVGPQFSSLTPSFYRNTARPRQDSVQLEQIGHLEFRRGPEAGRSFSWKQFANRRRWQTLMESVRLVVLDRELERLVFRSDQDSMFTGDHSSIPPGSAGL